MSISCQNFVRAFSITTPDKIEKTMPNKKENHLFLNLFKMSAYIPILGIASQTFVAVLICRGDKLNTAGKVAFVFRAILSPLAIITLTPLDLAGTIMFAIMKKRNKGLNPVKDF